MNQQNSIIFIDIDYISITNIPILKYEMKQHWLIIINVPPYFEPIMSILVPIFDPMFLIFHI